MDFVSQMSHAGALFGTTASTERLLSEYLPPDRFNVIMEEIRGPAGRNMWEKLSNVQPAVLANYLKNEYPQTVAVVLSPFRAQRYCSHWARNGDSPSGKIWGTMRSSLSRWPCRNSAM